MIYPTSTEYTLVYSASRINDKGQGKMWMPFSHHREPSTYWWPRGHRARKALTTCGWLPQHAGTVSTTAVRQVWWVPEKMKGAKKRESGRVTTLCFFFSLFLTLWRAKKLKGCKPGGHLGYARSRGQLPTYTEFLKKFILINTVETGKQKSAYSPFVIFESVQSLFPISQQVCVKHSGWY